MHRQSGYSDSSGAAFPAGVVAASAISKIAGMQPLFVKPRESVVSTAPPEQLPAGASSTPQSLRPLVPPKVRGMERQSATDGPSRVQRWVRHNVGQP
jgi:hypothetical protein